MNGNATFRHQNTALLAIEAVEAPLVVTSETFDEQLSAARKRLRIPPQMLQRVAGVMERRWWNDDFTFQDGASAAGAKAIAAAGIDPQDVGLMINTSVTRANLEPSVAVKIHHELGLPSSAMNFDITNACLGFVNGMTLAANMIEAGQIKYAVIVNGEDSKITQQATVERLNLPSATRDDFNNEFATLTLGSGAAAAVIGPADIHPEGHKILGGVTRAATQHHGICVGDFHAMRTDTKALLEHGLELVVSAWEGAQEAGWCWANMDRYIMHQVSNVHTRAISKKVNLDRKKIPLTFPTWGNVGPASLPMTLAKEAANLVKGNRVLCMGVGSGLNTAMTEILW